MSLWWELKGIADHDALWETCEKSDVMRGREKGEQYLNGTTYTLIWMMAGIGIDSITEDNAHEVYARIAFLEKFKGAMRYGPAPDRADVYFTPEEVSRHVGLKTNASKLTEAEFLKRCKDWLGDLKQEYLRAEAARTAAVWNASQEVSLV